MIIDTGSDYEFLSYKGFPPFARFDIEDQLSRLIVSVENPTNDEIANYRKDRIRIRATTIENIVWLTFEIGDLPIVDAPFSLHLTKKSINSKSFKKNLKTLRISLIDSMTGKTTIQLQYSLSDEFVDELEYLILLCYNMQFDESTYLRLIDSICNSLSPTDIFNDSSIEYNSDENTYAQLELEIENNGVLSSNMNEIKFEKTTLNPDDRLLAENDEYAFYGLWLGGKILRKNKLTGEVVIFCTETSTGPAAIFGEKFYWYDSFGILSDKYIYRSNIDGSKKEKLDILDNSKERWMYCNGFCRNLSTDKVERMYVEQNKLRIVVDKCFSYEDTGRNYKYIIEFETSESMPKFHMFEDELLRDVSDGFFYPKEFKTKKELTLEANKILTQKKNLIHDVAKKRNIKTEDIKFIRRCYGALLDDMIERGFSKTYIKKWKKYLEK